MSYAKGIVFAFGHSRETTNTLVFAVCVKLILPSGEYLMPVGLVSYVPDYLVIGSIIDIMECYCQLNNPKACPEMTGIGAYLVNYMLPELVTEFDKLKPVKLSEVFRCIYIF